LPKKRRNQAGPLLKHAILGDCCKMNTVTFLGFPCRLASWAFFSFRISELFVFECPNAGVFRGNNHQQAALGGGA
jgi:hypothetical protein